MTDDPSARASEESTPQDKRPVVVVSMLSPEYWRPFYKNTMTSLYLTCDMIWDRIRSTIGLISSAVGFFGNFVVDASITETRAHWSNALGRLIDYLDDSGIKDELNRGLNTRFIGNLSIMDNIQRALHLDRRLHCSHDEDHSVHVPATEEAAAFMRYATAAYGSEMIASAWLETDECYLSTSMDAVTNILNHVGVTTNDIVVMNVEYGEDSECLRHFCVVDHARKAVVLSVRGTFSMTGVLVDLVGFCEPFCGGEAHSGMATMANAVWAKSSAAIAEKLSNLPDYEFVITGHSLGAGVACLLNILVYHENTIPLTHKVRCFAFAPPPTFHPISAAPEAVQNATAYIHQRDIVPFLSVNGVRRFFSLMSAVDESSKHLYFWQKASIDWNFSKPSPAMVAAARSCHASDLPETDGAPIVVIPVRVVVWIEKERHECFNQKVCDPHKLAKVGILVNPDMITDHGPAKYEAAFKYLNEED